MNKCTQLGCTGQIVDSVCDVCGHFYDPTSAPVAATADQCTQSGCNGKIVDSICEVCGHLYATALPATPSLTSITGATGVTGSGRVSTQSTRLARATKGSGSHTRRIQRVGMELLRTLGVPEVVSTVKLIPPVVPPNRRTCGKCGQRVVEDQGVCPKCHKPYSLVPQLKADPDHPLLDRFEIKGTMAFGGMGWIYLAHDRLLGRNVVLKGLKDSQDPELAAIAAREREFLAQVEHPSIVKIYDFLVYGGQGYIVMELVEGRSLESLRNDHDGILDPVEACTYILEILPAMGYLDSKDLVHCDFKDANVIVHRSGVKLIDLGTVRHIDDSSDVYGSPGFTAPEASAGDPSPLSDLWSVGKTLAVLVANFDYKGKYQFTLPPLSEVPLFREHESLYHFLLKATRENPAERFQTAEEMAQQLSGVIRQLLRDRGDLPAVESALFGEDLATRDGMKPVRPDLLAIPSLKPDPTDPASQLIAATFPIPDADRRREAYAKARAMLYADSRELALHLANELIAYGTGEPDGRGSGKSKKNSPAHLLDSARGINARDWRASWVEAQLAFAQGDRNRARQLFESVEQEIPGEIAPKLALGVIHESLGNFDEALRYYELVSTVAPSYTGAAFGIGRICAAKNNRAGAIKAYLRVPTTSSRYTAALTDLVRVILDPKVAAVGRDEILQAADVLGRMRADETMLEPHEIAANLCRTAAELVEEKKLNFSTNEMLLGTAASPKDLRRRAESEFRACARIVTDKETSFAFVDLANQVRPRTTF